MNIKCDKMFMKKGRISYDGSPNWVMSKSAQMTGQKYSLTEIRRGIFTGTSDVVNQLRTRNTDGSAPNVHLNVP